MRVPRKPSPTRLAATLSLPKFLEETLPDLLVQSLHPGMASPGPSSSLLSIPITQTMQGPVWWTKT